MFSKVGKIVGGIFAVFVVLALIGACFGDESGSSVSKPEYESQKGTFTNISGTRMLKTSCEAGDKKACEKLDFVDNLTKKCGANDGKACTELGIMLDKRQIDEVDLKIEHVSIIYGVNFFHKACNLNYADGCYRAWALTKTESYASKACELNHINACLDVGEDCASSYNPDRRYSKSAEYYSKACDLGSSAGCNNAGVAYEDGAINFATAKKLYEKACKMGSEKGCKNAKRIVKQRGL